MIGLCDLCVLCGEKLWGMGVNYLGPEEHAAFLKAQYDYLGKVLKAIHGN